MQRFEHKYTLRGITKVTGEAFKEAVAINKSLSALLDVIVTPRPRT